MYHQSTHGQPPPQKAPRNWDRAVWSLTALETLLVSMALITPQMWSRLLPSASSTLNGPFPASIAPVITLLLYALPTVIGFLNRDWQRAILLATLPAWIGLGIFLIGATFKIGAFYLVSADHVTANVSVLELFAALGGIGWLARSLLKMR
ncbi:hypothetical protein [Tengunoibacter tsumagoiensis]|uniref:Uncharacterized protein n=1 Tax=Tengunoibacter tsumagoiensis TaxID=2014871 RepID=A0A402A246_9CHLR|nr:hypothetical protein [Tengunoibacter tsumagoiensis]GCE13071.1 hypothetical protein KTT_29300 [Tengunoibacter tsumagoiensis]